MDRIWRIVGFGAVVVLAAAGCGSSDGTGENDEAAIRDAIAAFEERAKADGYTAEADDEDDDELEFASEECQEFDAAFPEEDDLPGQTASGDSKSFTRGELVPGEGAEETLDATAGAVEEPDDLDEMFGLLRDDRMTTCMQEAVEQTFTQDPELEGVELGEVRVDVVELDDIGDDAMSIRVATTMGMSGLTFPIAFDFTMARSGRAAVMVGAATIGGDAVKAPVAELAGSLLSDLQLD